MPLPGDLTSITVTGKFLDGSGNPLGGTVMFWPSQELTDTDGMVVIGMTPITAQVSSSTGEFSQVLACTDNANLLPLGWTWKIQVAVAGAQQVFNAYIPHTLGSTVDISALGPVGGLPSVSGAYVVSVNGQSGVVTVGGGASLPLTTLGDTLYENATPAPARLAGNTSATKKYLTQAGTGSVSAAPAWGTIAAADLPAATVSAQGAVELAGTSGVTYAGVQTAVTATGTPATDYANLQAAFNGGGKILLAGAYNIGNNTLTFSVTGTVVEGTGWGTQIQWDGTGGIPCMAMADTTDRRIFIRDLRLTQSSGASAGKGIDASYFQNSVIERVLIDGVTNNPNIGVAFNAAGCHYNVLSDSRINCDGSNAMGVQFDSTANSNVVRNCRILPSVTDTSQIGVWVNANSITLDHIDIESAAGTGISLGALGHSCTIRDAYMENNGTHVVFASGVSNPLLIGGSYLTPVTAMFTDNGAIAPSWINMRSGSSTPFTKAIFQQLSSNGQILRVINRQSSPTDVSLRVENLNGGELAIGVRATADSANRWQADSSGHMTWGSGSGSGDVGLQRSGAGVLQVSTGHLDANSQKITGLANGSAGTDAAAFGQIPVADATAGDFQPDGVAAAGANGKWSDSGHVHPWQPYQFAPEAYGAKGNGNVINDAAITASTATLTSSTANFTSADAGKSILVTGAGAAGADLFTTISAFTNSTTVTLAANAGTTVTANGAVYGTDDTAAIQSCLNAAVAYGEASVSRYCELVFGSKIYVIAAAPQLGGAGLGNAQILLPYLNSSAAGRKLVIAFRGTQDPGSMTFDSSGSGSHETTPPFFGTCLACLRLDGTNNGTYGPASVIGGPNDLTPDSQFTNLNVIIDGLNITVPHEPTYGGFDLGFCAEATVVKGSCQAMCITASGGAWFQYSFGPSTNTFAYGLRMPVNANNDLSHIGMFTANGIGNGAYLSMACNFGELRVRHCTTGLLLGTLGGDMSEGICGRYYLSYKNNAGMTTEGSSHAIRVVIQCVELNNSGHLIVDSGNTMTGYVGVRYPSEPSYGAVVLTGAPGVRVIDIRQYTGPLASPQAPPSSTAAWQNQYYRDAWITLSTSGGTVSALTISNALQSAAQNITGGAIQQFFLPAGASYTPTYTGTLSHTVTLA